jgi:hypothetical protein
MFTPEGDAKVHALVEQAREYAGLDGPHNPVEQAWRWLMNELDVLGRDPATEEATDTAVREACYERLFWAEKGWQQELLTI